jgi:hypothetical protein
MSLATAIREGLIKPSRLFLMSGALACLLVLPATADAGGRGIQRGFYSCMRVIAHQFYAGDAVQIVDANTYRVDYGKRSRYAYNAGTRHIKFVTGPFRRYFAKYSPRETLFRVFSKKTGRLYETCDR